MRVTAACSCGARPPALPVDLPLIATPHPLKTKQRHQAAWTAPDFCKGLECPQFTVVKTLPGGIELRRYEPASWASVTSKAMDMDAAMRTSFMKLFSYISGSNAASKRIDMTAPVTTKVEPGQGPACESTFTVSFYNPPAVAKAGAPAPTAGDVKITTTPAMEVYVLPYGGWSSAQSARDAAARLADALAKAGEKFAAAPYYVAGYDSPTTIFNRRNEVWLLKK